jgi:hypothetical protein
MSDIEEAVDIRKWDEEQSGVGSGSVVVEEAGKNRRCSIAVRWGLAVRHHNLSEWEPSGAHILGICCVEMLVVEAHMMHRRDFASVDIPVGLIHDGCFGVWIWS